MKPNVLNILLAYLLLPNSVFASEPQKYSFGAEIQLSGQIGFTVDEEHPTKYDRSTDTFCGGRPSKTSVDKATGQSQRYNSKFNEVYYSIATPGVFSSILNQHVAWSTSFDQEDYVFELTFKKMIGEGHTRQHKSPCSIKTFKYAHAQAKTQGTLSATVLVPENIWLVKIKPTVTGNESSFKYNLVSAAAIPKDSQMAPNFDELPAIAKKEESYFFVKPGSEIQIQITVDDDLGTFDLLGKFEITFVGYHRCDKFVSDFLNIPTQAGLKNISPQKIQQQLGYAAKSILTLQKDSNEQLVKAMNFLGCLTSQQMIDNLIFESDITQFNGIIQNIQIFSDFTQSVQEDETGSSLSDQINSNFQAIRTLRTLQHAAAFSLSEAFINSLKPYCVKYDALTMEGPLDVLKEHDLGFTVLNNHMTAIGRWLGALPFPGKSATVRIDEQYKTAFVAISNLAQSNKSYAHAAAKQKDSVESAVAEMRLAYKEDDVNKLFRAYYGLPALRPNRAFANFHKYLLLMRDKVEQLDKLLLSQFEKFDDEDDAAIEIGNAFQMVDELAEIMNRTQSVFDEIYQFRARISANSDVAFAAQQMREARAFGELWLTQSYGGFLADFMKFQRSRFEKNQNLLTDEQLVSCLAEVADTLKK